MDDRLRGLTIEASDELKPGDSGWEPVTGADVIHTGIWGPNPPYDEVIEKAREDEARYEALQAAGDNRSYLEFLMDTEDTDG